MPQISVLSGIYTDNGPDVRVSTPVNRVPVPGPNGVSNGYLRPAEGITGDGVGDGITRGEFFWPAPGLLYAVQGTSFCTRALDGTVTPLGTVADGGPISWAYSFDRLAFTSGGRLYYWDLSTLTEVTDPNLGVAVAVVWIQGFFFVLTDDDFVVATDLTDPTSIGPFSYATAESSPDPTVAILALRNELYMLGRTTIEVFANAATPNFPFAVIQGAQITKGCVGTFACCVFNDAIAFVGSGANEAPAVYVGANGGVTKISTIEQDRQLATYTENELSSVYLETRNDTGLRHLYVHLPDRTLVFDAVASQAFETAVWFTLTTSLVGFSQYRARYFNWFQGVWTCADPSGPIFGHLDPLVGSHYGDPVRFEFSTPIVYNEARGIIVNSVELIPLSGRVALGDDPVITTSSSLDGVTWSQDIPARVGTIGNRQKRVMWNRLGRFPRMHMRRFRGDSTAQVSFLRLDAEMEALLR
jgi:hypothetical protein